MFPTTTTAHTVQRWIRMGANRGMEYISREAAIKAARIWNGDESTEAWIQSNLEKLPAADVAPVRHGTWVYNPGDNIPYCSECMMPQDSECNYCPSCGADMREES